MRKRGAAEPADVPDDLSAADAVVLPSLGTLHRSVRRDLEAGRALEVPAAVRTRVTQAAYDRALADLRLDEVFDEVVDEPAPTPGSEEAGSAPVVSGPRVRLYTPGARLVATGQVAAVVEALGHVAAARGVLCVYGDPGRGKTIAVERALALLPQRMPVWRAAAPVGATLAQLRRVVASAVEVAPKTVHQSVSGDRALANALARPGVFFLDDVQRLTPPLLDYLRLLWDDPRTTAALVVCGAGAERSLAQAPALASRVLSWHEVACLEPTQLPDTLSLFHNLWHTAAPADIRHLDDTVARGNFRAWAKITSHLHATVTRNPEAAVDRALLTQACTRLGPYP